MGNKSVNRRDFLKLGMAATTGIAAAAAFPKFTMAQVKTVTLSECMEMSPEEMAKSSRLVMDSWRYILDTVATIQNPDLRSGVESILRNPAPTLMANLMDGANRKEVYQELCSKNLIQEISFDKFLPPTRNPYRSPHPFIAAPGSGYSSHHSYPGGLANHTALNTMVSLSIYEGYKQVYGYALDRDVVIASQVLHDLHKPWVFQWGPSGESRTELKIGETGEHHPLSVAESMTRGLPPEVCVAQACAHNHPGWPKDEAGPVNWITAASILTGKDPVQGDLLARDRQTLPLPRRMENFVCHLGDHDWILTVPAAKWIIPVMEGIAVEKYGMAQSDLKTKKFNQFRNYVFSQASIMSLYEVYSTRGKDALAYTVLSIVAPA
jgi:hypothetical protein